MSFGRPLSTNLPPGTTLANVNSAALLNSDDGESDGPIVPPASAPLQRSGSLPDIAGAVPFVDKFQVEGFLKAMQKLNKSFGRHSFFPSTSTGSQVPEKSTIEDMLCFQKDPIATSVLKINNDLVKQAVEIFKFILKYMGIDPPEEVSLDGRIELVGHLYKQGLENPELRDELFAQILKQTRNNPDKQYSIRAWELMYLCAACMPPSTDIGGFLTEYVRKEAEGANNDPDIKVLASSTLNALKISCTAGPRQKIPGREEIKALLTGKQLTATVLFLDETSEEITYGIGTTVAEAVEELAGIMKLREYSSFSLFECRKVVAGSKSPEPGNEEYIGLDDKRYIGDLLADFNAPKDPSKGDMMLRKLVFRKKFFRESDEAIEDPVFVYLSYIQLQNDFIRGNYPDGREDAAQLAALQILVENGYVVSPKSSVDWATQLDHFLPKHIAENRPIQEWVTDILFRYRSMENLTKNEARQQFLRILRALPYGHSIFFNVRKSEDPLGLLPGKFTLAINNRGVHFFRPVPIEYLHSAELREIMRFGSSSRAVFFKLRVADVLQVFQFETTQGEEICASLKTHINDHILRQKSTAKSPASGSPNGDIPARLFESDAGKELVEVNKKLLEERREMQKREAKLQQELEGLKAILRSEKQRLMEVTSDRDKLRALCDQKDSEAAEKQILEEAMAILHGNNRVFESTAKKEQVKENKKGEEICASLETHINDVMLRSNSTAKSPANEAAQKCLCSSISKQIWVVMEKLRNLGKACLKSNDSSCKRQ